MLVTETREQVSNKLDEWREALEGKGLRISHTKAEYLRYDFIETSPVVNQRCPLVKQLLKARPSTSIWDRSFKEMGRLTEM